MRKRFIEASENDIILDTIYELSHYKYDDVVMPSYFNIKDICDNYGLTKKEAIDIATKNGYNVFKLNGDDYNSIIIADSNLSYEDILQDYNDYVDLFKVDDESDSSFSMTEAKQKLPKVRWHYYGPVRYYKDIITRDYNDYTYARDEEEAFRHFNSKARQKYGYTQDAQIFVFKDYIELSPLKDEEEITLDIKCDRCGRELLDDGTCPVCDRQYHFDFDRKENSSYNKESMEESNDMKIKHTIKEELVSDEEAFWNMRNETSKIAENKYDEVNLVLDGDKIRPVSKEELANKFAVSIEHADEEDYKSKEELESIANKVGAEKIMFFVYKGQYGGEYSFLVKDEQIAKDLAKEYKQKSYAKYDDKGEYHEVFVESLEEAEEPIEYLEYDKLPIKVWFKVFDADEISPEEWDYYEKEISYDYKVPVSAIEDEIYYILAEDEDGFEDYSREELKKYIKDNYDDLLDKYYNRLLDKFEEEASEEAESNYQDEPDYDLYREDLKESKEEVVEETSEYKIVKTVAHHFKTVNGVARKGKDKEIYQVYFRTQDFNPSVNRWMNKGWSNSTAEFDTIEDARAFVKKYGKTLKSDLGEESLKESENKSIKKQIKDILDKYNDEKTSRIMLFEISPETNDKPELWIEKFDGVDIDFSKFAEHEQKDEFNYPTKGKYYSFMISGGLNGSGNWEDYLSDIKDIFRDFKHELNLEPVLYKVDTDIADDVWTAKVFLYERPTKKQLEECLLRTLEEDIEKQMIKEALKSYPNVEIEFGMLSNEDEIIKWALENIKDADEDTIREVIKELLQVGFEHGSASKEADYEEGSLEEDIEKHDTLNSKLFDGEELKPEVKETVEKIAQTFVNELKESDITFDLKDIVLLGSNVSYNYTKDSDLDIHLIADSSNLHCPEDLYPLLYSAYVSIFNKNYDITIKDIPAEIYVEMDEPHAISKGIYSLKDGWLKKPVPADVPEIDMDAFEKLFTEWEDKYFALLDKINEELSDEIYDFIEDIYDLRKDSVAKEGEFGLGNLVFKEFRNLGYLDNLKELRKKEKGKELSLK